MSRDELILICAVRYALGRQSCVVDVVCDHVYCNRKKLSEECRNIICRDIEETRQLYHKAGQTLEAERDEYPWLKLMADLKEVRNE